MAGSLLALAAVEMPADAIEVGRIADAWGVKGWFKVLPHSASPEALFSSKHWFLLPCERGAKTFSGVVQLPVTEAKVHADTIVANAKGVADRNAAELLKGARIFVSRSHFPAAGADEYYWVDLIGLTVLNREGLDLGTVKELLSTGPQTVLVIVQPQADGAIAERMIPFVSAYVDRVDLATKCITVDWQLDY